MWRKAKQSIAVNILIGIFGIFLCVHAFRVVRQAFAVKEEMIKEQQNIAALQQKKAALEEEIRELGTKEAVQREGKKELNMKLPGEEVVVVVPEKKTENKEVPAEPSFWEKIRQTFNR